MNPAAIALLTLIACTSLCGCAMACNCRPLHNAVELLDEAFGANTLAEAAEEAVNH